MDPTAPPQPPPKPSKRTSIARVGLPAQVSRHRVATKLVVDVASVLVGFVVATAFRLFEDNDAPSGLAWLALIAVALVAMLVASHLTVLHRGRWQYATFEEILALARSVALTAVIVVPLAILFGSLTTGLLAAAALLMALALSLIVRVVWRLRTHYSPTEPSVRERLLVFGAGNAGTHIVRFLLSNRLDETHIVGILDDHPSRQRLRVRGIPVMGGRADLATVARETQATALLIAIPSAAPKEISEIAETAALAGLRVSVLPSPAEIVSGDALPSDIRPIDTRELLGRRVVQTDVAELTNYLDGKRILVTGAGGSIGSELCRQLSTCNPSELLMLDHNESALHAVQMSIEGRALLDSPNLILADIRDPARIDDVFRRHRPEIVFHAAAAKHLPLLEMHPGEGLKTNVWGTLALLDAADRYDVTHFVNISTDKAADPTSVLGYSKRIAERLTAHRALVTQRRYVSVRFGNVLGSSGSVVPAFEAQIEAGGPITVTHADVTRYFMMVGEAVELVLQAGAIGRPGEALILDMGEPVKIADLARRLIEIRGRDIPIVFTGLRPGEKLHEDLIGPTEQDVRPYHPLITHTPVPPLNPAVVLSLEPDDRGVRSEIEQLATADLNLVPADPRERQSV